MSRCEVIHATFGCIIAKDAWTSRSRSDGTRTFSITLDLVFVSYLSRDRAYFFSTRIYHICIYLHIICVCVCVYIRVCDVESTRFKKECSYPFRNLYAVRADRETKKKKKGKRTEKYKNVEKLNWKFGYRSFEPRFGSMSVKIIAFNLLRRVIDSATEWKKKKK